MDRHARRTIEKIDPQDAALFLGEGRLPYRKRKQQRARCGKHAQVQRHFQPPVQEGGLGKPAAASGWPVYWALLPITALGSYHVWNRRTMIKERSGQPRPYYRLLAEPDVRTPVAIEDAGDH